MTTLPKVCLNMILRDEEANIERALNSVKYFVDAISIVDTGSKDSTVAVATAWAKANGFEDFIIKQVPWEDDFGLHRTQALRQGRYNFPECDYALTLDGDEELWLGTDKPPSSLAEGNLLKQFIKSNNSPDLLKFTTLDVGGQTWTRDSMFCQQRQHMVWKWSDPRHEILVNELGLPGTSAHVPESMAKIKANRDGYRSKHPGTMLTDALAYEKAMAKEPNGESLNARWWYYMGQSYMDAGKHKRAYETWKHLITSPTLQSRGWVEEKYLAAMNIGKFIMNRQVDSTVVESPLERAVPYFIRAMEYNPHRVEAYYYLTDVYRQLGRNNAGYHWGKLGVVALERAKCNGSMGSWLFVTEQDIYEWKMYDCASICAGWASDPYAKADALAWMRAIVEVVPEVHKPRIVSNISVTVPSTAGMPLNLCMPAKKTCLIIDNFLKDPWELRKFALAQEFGTKGNYPGARTKSFVNDYIKGIIEKALGEHITYWPGDYNCSFQFATVDMKSWIHSDATDYGAILYLSPDAPVGSGTAFYMHKETGLHYPPEEQFHKQNNTTEEELEPLKAIINTPKNGKPVYQDMSLWEETDRVANVFNRFVMFDGRRYHSSLPYFGNSKETGRLFLCVFFNTMERNLHQENN